jgi:hypothetical protein
MLKQMNYIIKQKGKTEERIINGTTLLRKSLIEYNKLLQFTQELKNSFFDLYFKIKFADPPGKMPIEDDELRLFRTVDAMSKKSLFKEISEVNESKLLLESLHDKTRSEKKDVLGLSPKKGI